MLEDESDGDGGFEAAHCCPGLGKGAGRNAEGRARNLGGTDELIGRVHGAAAAVVADRRERLDDEPDGQRPAEAIRLRFESVRSQRLRGPAPSPSRACVDVRRRCELLGAADALSLPLQIGRRRPPSLFLEARFKIFRLWV